MLRALCVFSHTNGDVLSAAQLHAISFDVCVRLCLFISRRRQCVQITSLWQAPADNNRHFGLLSSLNSHRNEISFICSCNAHVRSVSTRLDSFFHAFLPIASHFDVASEETGVAHLRGTHISHISHISHNSQMSTKSNFSFLNNDD